MKTAFYNIKKLIGVFIFLLSTSASLYSQQTLTQINGWNAYVHLPDDYNSTGSKTYPVIVFFPGIGEVGSNASALLSYGPGNFIASGWNGNIAVNGTTVKPIIISLQPPSGYPPMVYVDQEIEAIKKLYRVDINRINLTGLSQGGWMAEMYAMAYPDKVASIVALTAVKPDDNPAYPTPFATFAKDCGHALEYEQIYDARDMETITKTMNAAVAGSGTYIQTNVGGGGHCCWNTWYDPSHTDNYSLNGASGNWNIYQYMMTWARCSTAPPSQPGQSPPTVSAGSPQTITLAVGGGSGQSASFNFSNSPVPLSGWTNMAGQPGQGVISASGGGVTLSSVSASNWAPYSGATSYDGGGVNAAGYFNNAAVTVNNWHQYGDPAALFSASKPQLQATGLSAGAVYTVKMSGSNNFSLNANPTRYTVIGASTYGPIDVNLNGQASNGAAFTGVQPDGSGAIRIYVNTVAGTSQLAQINGLQISSGGGSQSGSATLTGTATAGSGATIKSTSWSLVSGNAVTIGSASNLSTSVSGLTAGTYVFQLTATDNAGLSSNSRVTLTVNGASSATPPTVSAGNAQTITLAPAITQSASFNFSNSSQSLSGWANMAGQPGQGVISASGGGITLSSVSASNWAPYSGATSFDGGGVNAAGYFNNAAVTVNNWHQYGDPAALFSASKPQLQATGLSTGALYTVKMSGSNNFNLNANPTRYTVIGASTYGPIDVNLNGQASNGAAFTGVQPDGSGAIRIYVNTVAGTSQLAQINGLQISSGGGSQPGSITLTGTASAGSGATIKSTSWSLVSGNAVTIGSASNLSTSVSGLTAGTYVFQLTATDNAGLSSNSRVTITVNGASSATPPTVSAGNALSVTLPNNLNLSGTASGNNGATIKSTTWTKLSGGAATIASTSSLNTSVSGLVAGNYVFQLTVTDNNGLSSSSTVAVSVSAASGGSGNCGCDITLSPNPADGQVYLDGQTLGVKPGNTVCLKAGHYVSIGLFHFYGTPSQPIRIINCGGQVNISGYVGYGFALHSSRYVQVTGTGDAGYKYGILMDGSVANTTVGFAEDAQSSDIEVDHLEVTKTSGIGIACAPTPNCDPSTWSDSWKMYNMSFHDNYIHETLDEGFYIGNTQNDYVFNCTGSNITVHPQQIDTLKFYNNILDKVGWTSAQISQVSGFLDMHDNLITNFGYANQTQHQAGIIVGALTRGRVYNNKVLNGTGSAIQVFGNGLVQIYNNVFANAGYDGTAGGQNAVLMDDRPAPAGTPGLKVYLVNNTIINPKRVGISFYDDYHTVATGGIIANNLITAPGFLPSLVAYIDLQDKVPIGLSNNLTLLTTLLGGFVNAGGNDYHLLSGSLAINSGIDASAYGVTTDMDGNRRPLGGAFDIGAYEFPGSGSSSLTTNTLATSSLNRADSVATANGEAATKLTLYPNPARDLVNIAWTSRYNGPATISLHDATGRMIKSMEVTKSQADYNDHMVIGEMTPGMYILVIRMKDGTTLTKKVLKQ